MVLRADKRSGDYVYEARHSFIAHTVYEAALRSEDERFDNIMRVCLKLNTAFSYDLEVLARIIKAENLRKTLSTNDKIRQVFDAVEESLGQRAVILHQRGIFEMQVADEMQALDAAEEFIERAATIEPFNKSIKHSLAELHLRRSRISSETTQRQAWRQSAINKASALTGGVSAYPHHTILKASIDAVKDALSEVEVNATEAATQRLGSDIADAESALQRGLRAFPNEAILLSEEGILSQVLSKAERAEQAFEKAHAANPRSTLIAKRLARIKRSKRMFPQAREVLRSCIEFNPGAKDLHYDLALTVIESAPDADQSESELVLYHLRRSYQQGDSNYQAQFWYARQLSICNLYTEAKPLFKTLGDARIAYREKREVRGVVKTNTDVPRRFEGQIIVVRDNYCLVACQAPQLIAFLSLSDNYDTLDSFAVDDRVYVELGFNLLGPNVTKMLKQ